MTFPAVGHRLPMWLLACLFYVGTASLSYAVIETYDFSDGALQVRYKQLSAELRCPKCQNQNIADSDAPIARDLRKLLHRQLEAGATDDEIKEYMVARYGEFVLYRPRFEGVTLLLWMLPLALLLAAGLLVYRVISGAKESAVTPDELDDVVNFEATLASKISTAAQPEKKS